MESLAKYVKHGAAFGPTDAGLILVDDRAILRKMFDPNNKIYDALKLNPSIVIGRRGSGKTAYLHSVFIDTKYDSIQEIRTSKTFSQIVSEIEKNIAGSPLVEEIEGLWEELFYLSLMAWVAEKYGHESKELAKIADFVARIDPNAVTSVESFLWKIVQTLSKKATGNFVGAVAAVIQESTGVSFDNAKRISNELLEKKGIRAILLLDSLEQYPVHVQSVSHALSGLLKCAGQFNCRNERFNLRLCLPAELYHEFFDHVSTNPLKDLAPPNAFMLHWIASELLSIAAHRLSLYLELYYPDHNVSKTDLSSRDGARRFLKKFLPDTITNGLGRPEDSLAYILRHTQLQPRHLLQFLNTIFEKARRTCDSYPVVDELAVKSAISETEHLLAEEVFSGYKMLYPAARKVCEACIPELPLSFSEADLQKVFNRKGKKASAQNDFYDFRRILVETGIVGRVVGTTDRYIIGRFEYTEPHKLAIGASDQLCLHPVFAEVFHFKSSGGGNSRAVYPYGSDPDEGDHRTWI